MLRDLVGFFFTLGFWWVVAALFIYASPLTPNRINRFTSRRGITLTPPTGKLVLDALATTRRWRIFGVMMGLAASLTWTPPTSESSDPDSSAVLYMFIGWVIGALIAEWRITGLRSINAPRVASLQPRRLTSYISPLLARALAVGVVFVAGCCAWGLVNAWRNPSLWREVAPTVGAMLAYLFVLAFLVNRVVQRAQSTTDESVRSTDNALRTQSIRVLLGTAVVLLGIGCSYLVFMREGDDMVPIGAGSTINAAFFLSLIFFFLGYHLATSPQRPRPELAPA